MQQYGYLYNKLAKEVDRFSTAGSPSGTPVIYGSWTYLVIVVAIAVFIGIYRYGT